MSLPKLSVCFAAGLLLAACQVDKQKVTEQVTTMFKDQLSLTVKKVNCPEKMNISKGAKYDCDVDVEPEGTVPITVELTDSTGSALISTKYKVVTPDKLAADITKQLGVQGTVDCGKRVQILKPDSSWKCGAKTPDGDHEVEVKVDAEGGLSYHAL
ncbi:MAG: DUF4333 domain-containing protein [Polyangiaceae bacterium]